MAAFHPPEIDLTTANDGRFERLVAVVADQALFLLDAIGNVASWNAGAQNIARLAAGDAIGRPLSEFFVPDDPELREMLPLLEIASRMGRIELEGWRVHSEAAPLRVRAIVTAIRDPNGGLSGFGCQLSDIAEAEADKERLHRNEQQFRMLVQQVDEYAIFMLDPEGRVVSWNAGAERIKGYTTNEIIGKKFDLFYTVEDRDREKPRDMLYRARAEGHVRDLGVRVRKDGTVFHADVLLTAIRDETGKLVGFSKVTRDITDQMRARDLEAAKLAAEKAAMAKDEFLAVLSHELRTPLTPVLAASSYLQERAALLPEELKEVVSRLNRNVLLEARLIDDLLDLTKIGRGKIELHFELVDLHTASRNAMEIVADDIQAKSLVVRQSMEANEHFVWADPVRIQQVLWNLLSNAVKFTPQGGCITLHSFNPEPNRVCFEVSDTGAGIELENLARIFNVFEQGERTITRRYGGLGLGLAISKSLVEMHGGTISAVSGGAGMGSTFRLTLETRLNLGRKAVSENRDEATPARTLRILLAEDHEDTRRVLSRLLAQSGHQVVSAASMGDAAAELERMTFDLLLSDIGLPDATGYDLVRVARKLQPGIRAVALSGFGMDEDLARSEAAGFDRHLIKPVDFTLLRALLHELFPSE